MRHLPVKQFMIASGTLAACATPAIAATVGGGAPAHHAPGTGGPQHTAGAPTARVDHGVIRLGDQVAVSGRADTASVLLLQARKPAAHAWRTLSHTRPGADGSYSLRARLPRTALLRVAAQAATTGGAAPVAAVAPDVTASGPVHVKVRADVTLRAAGRPASVTGRVRPARAGRSVVVQRRADGRWQPVARASTGSAGRFAASWPPAAGTSRVRAVFAGDRANARDASSSVRVAGMPPMRAATASWYGPGLYGNPMACGGTLTAGTLGVAHKTLPCGTRVTIRHGSATVTVPVVDRGPFVAGREFDLTSATKDALGFSGTGVVRVSI